MMNGKKEIIAVLTGDIVASSKIENKDRLIKALKGIFVDIRTNIYKDAKFDIYRGDSFQGVVPGNLSLSIALIIRAGLLSFEEKSDARIGIGLGSIKYLSDKVVESNGEAFINSGHLIDILEKEKNRLGIKTPWTEISNLLDALINMIDAIVNDWTKNDAETAYQVLLYNLTQNELAKKLNISQPAINKRIARAKMDVIRYVLEKFEETINKQIIG